MTETQTRTMRVGRRTWQVRTTWEGRGTRQVRVTRTEQRRTGWQQDRWQDVSGRECQVRHGETVSEVWQ